MKTISKTSFHNLEGQFRGFIYKDGYKIKYLRLEVNQKEYWVKVQKEQREELEQVLKPDMWLKLAVIAKVSAKTGKLSLKAESVETRTDINHNFSKQAKATTENKSQSPGKCILICQKSNCWKKGGEAVYQELTNNLAKHGLEEEVKVKKTGCLKKCKQGPNLIILPDRAHYTQVPSSKVPHLLEEHLNIGNG